jgi:hypothetical protein
MRTLILMFLIGCTQKEPAPASTGSATVAPPTEKDVAPPPADARIESDDGASEVAELVVHDVGSKALGSQKIEASCVSVVIMPAGKWTVAAAHLEDCGDKTARSILWLYKRAGSAGKWNEDYVGQPPKCWKGVPPDLIEPVTKATRLPSC